MTQPTWTADGTLVQEAGTAPVYVMAGGAKLHVPSVAEFTAMGYQWSQVVQLAPGSLTNVPNVPRDTTVLAERTVAGLWLIAGGRKFPLLTNGARMAMLGSMTPGLAVPQGCLDNVLELWIPAIARYPSRTPPSVVFPPSKAQFWLTAPGGPGTSKWWPRHDVPATVLPNGATVVTLRGWLATAPPGEPNTNDPDVAFDFDPDPAWLNTIGVDWATFFRVGDILSTGQALQGFTDHYAYAARPLLKVEVNGFPDSNHAVSVTDAPNWPGAYGVGCPPDWAQPANQLPDVQSGAYWPFHVTSDGGGPPVLVNGVETPATLQPGDYVEISGSFVTDQPHLDSTDYGKAAAVWTAGFTAFDEHCPASWSEIHPPDYVRLVDPTDRTGGVRRAEAVYGVAVASDYGTKSVTATLIPPGARPGADYYAQVTEHVGAESDLSSVTTGNANLTGAAITLAPESVQVSVAVTGQAPWPVLKPGKFKAIYRVRWAGTFNLRAEMDPPPASIPFDVAVTCSLTVVDAATNLPVRASALIGATVVGQSETPFVATFRPATKRVWIPPVRREPGGPVMPGHWALEQQPVPLVVHAEETVTVNGETFSYPDTTVLVGTTRIIDTTDITGLLDS